MDPEDRDVADGEPSELALRGPTLFSGYWRADETNASDFRGGWFHMGDMFRRRRDGRLDFVDRVKYMIKSGGENIYPAEIERVLLVYTPSDLTSSRVIRVDYPLRISFNPKDHSPYRATQRDGLTSRAPIPQNDRTSSGASQRRQYSGGQP